MHHTIYNNYIHIYINKYIGFLFSVNCLRVRGLEFPEHPERGKSIVLMCNYDLEEDGLYSVKWYRGEQEFFHFAPWEIQKKRAFRFPGIQVEVSKNIRFLLALI
jgi:hypothetical protein